MRPPLAMKLLLVAVDGRVDGAALDGFLAVYVVLITDGVLSEESCLITIPRPPTSPSCPNLVDSVAGSRLVCRRALVRRSLFCFPGALAMVGNLMTSSWLDLSWMRFLIRSNADSVRSDNISFLSLY